MHQGNIIALSPSLTHSGQRRIVLGHGGAVAWAVTRATVCFALRTPEEQGLWALTRLLVQGGLSDRRVVWGVTAATALVWLARAAGVIYDEV